jgi:glycosyltransferase involved in cell wall biosynthesis
VATSNHAPLSPRPGRLLAVNPVDHAGGAETTLLRLLSGLGSRGWRITLTTPGAGPLAESARDSGCDWCPLPVGGLGRGQGVRALASLRAARRLGADTDVLYFNGGVTGRLLAGCPSGTRRPLRVLHIHDMVKRASRLWRRADLVLADSGAVADRLRSLDPELSPLVVHLPVDLDPAVAAAPWPEPTGAPMVGFVGRLEPRKGVHELLAAVPDVLGARSDVRFVLIGDDPYAGSPAYTTALLADAAALGVIHVPWHDNAPGLMRHLDLLVLPSHEEPFGTVLAEAMAVGTPVVATAVDGLAEVVDDGVSGLLVPPGSPAALAEAILAALTRRDELGAAAARRARRWSTPAYVDRIEGLITPAAAA